MSSRKRWVLAGIATVMFLLLGLIYAWSVFVRPLEAEFGWLRSQTSMTFSISMVFFGFGGLLAGRLAKRMQPRWILCMGAASIFTGLSLASTVTQLVQLYAYYGIFVGGGVGMAFNALMNPIMRWFPDKQGIVSGLLLMGFGLGGSTLGSTAVFLMERFGWRSTFMILGIALGGVVAAGSFVIRFPRADEVSAFGGTKAGVAAVDLTTKETIRDRSFQMFFLWTLLVSAVGLALLSQAAPMASSFTGSMTAAAAIAGLISIFNGVGRMVYGILLDEIGSRKSLALISGGLALTGVVLVVAVVRESLPLLIAGYILGGFSYGGVVPSNSAYTGRIFGLKHYASNFAVINLNLLGAAFAGPYGAGLLRTASGTYASAMWLMVALAVVSLPVVFAMKKHSVPMSVARAAARLEAEPT